LCRGQQRCVSGGQILDIKGCQTGDVINCFLLNTSLEDAVRKWKKKENHDLQIGAVEKITKYEICRGHHDACQVNAGFCRHVGTVIS